MLKRHVHKNKIYFWILIVVNSELNKTFLQSFVSILSLTKNAFIKSGQYHTDHLNTIFVSIKISSAKGNLLLLLPLLNKEFLAIKMSFETNKKHNSGKEKINTSLFTDDKIVGMCN